MKACRLYGIVSILTIIVGCGGGGSHPPTSGDLKGDQSRVEVLRSMTPETWEEIAKALPEIETENPNASPEELGNKLWEKICQSKTRSSRSIIDDLYNWLVENHLTETEISLMAKASAYVFNVTIYATIKAVKTSHLVFVDELPDTEDKYIQTKSDAFKHSYWSALLCLYVNPEWSESITNAHEMTPRSQEPDTSMDLHNNAVGRYVYGLHHNDGAKALKAVLLDYAYRKAPGGHFTPDDRKNLGILIHINIFWDTERGWGSSNDFLLSKDENVKIISDTNRYFTETKIDGYRALFAKQEINGFNYAYIFTSSEIIRFALSFQTQKEPRQVQEIFSEIVKNFKLIKKTNL